MTDISIIIPIYKVEKFVARCVASVVRQKGVSTEIILVDDCGGDRSVTVAEEALAASGYDTYRVLRHDNNRGLSAARNTGTAEATGKYVYYLDSDDWLPSGDSLSLMFGVAEKSGATCVVGQYADCNAGTGETIQVPYKYGAPGMLQGEEQVRRCYAAKSIPVTAWNKLIRRDFLSEHKLLFKEGILHEDTLWTFQLMASLPSLYVLNKVTYNYAINPESIMNKMSDEKFRRREDSCGIVLDEMYKFLKNRAIQCSELSNYIEETRNYMYLKLLVDGLDKAGMRKFFRSTYRRIHLAQWLSMPVRQKVLHAYQLLPYPLSFLTYYPMATIQKNR